VKLLDISVSRIIRPKGMKTVYIDATIDTNECRITQIQISGDFFLYPPESLDELEERLKGCNSEECIYSVVDEFAEKTTAIGLDYDSLKAALAEILSDVCSELVSKS
jgi:hypothetical protein